jgi:hypothetical protein
VNTLENSGSDRADCHADAEQRVERSEFAVAVIHSAEDGKSPEKRARFQ